MGPGLDLVPEPEPDRTFVAERGVMARARAVWRGRWWAGPDGDLDRAYGVRLHRWCSGNRHRLPPLELAICWTIEDEGLEAAAMFLAELCDGQVWDDGQGWTVELARAAVDELVSI